MRPLVLTVSLSILLGATSVAAADTLTVTSSSPELTAERFEYRRVSTRVWYTWVGCWLYDVLQGSGWFPTTWYHEDDFAADGTVNLSRSLLENYCAAEMDEINTAWFTYADPRVADKPLRGAFTIVPGPATNDVVLCELVDVSSSYRNFECTDASVDVDERDVSVQVDIAL